MVSNFIGSAADSAFGFVDDAVGEDLARADEILSGKKRAPIDIEKEEAEFARGVDLATPDGDVPSTAAAPTDPNGAPRPATLSTSKRIEFIHFGRVHRDWASNFHHDVVLDDMAPDDLSRLVGSRAICFRAALEREVVLLAGIARATQAALNEKDRKEGATADLLTMAADMLGGAGTTSQTAVAADLKPFLEKIGNEVWTPLNKTEITYADLHTAGVKLHEVRANLNKYIRDQIEAKKNPPPAEAGLLSNLPFIGEIPLPSEIGDVIGFLQKVTGKLYDVQTLLIFDLLLVMQKPIEKACLKISLEQITKKQSPIYPIWFRKPPAAPPDQPFADYQQGDIFTGALKSVGPLDDANKAVKGAVADANSAVNDAVEPVMDVIDFLSKKVEPAPGVAYLADVFGAQKDPDGPIFGCEALGMVAVGSFARAVGNGEVPEFMKGFVGKIIKQVFNVCAEFLRAVYETLCALNPDEVVKSEELVAAGRKHLVFKLVDVALEKTGLTALLEQISFQIPQPPVLPPGINWPTETISAAPIIAYLKNKLAEELAPYLDPELEYAMAGLALRLNRQRVWVRGAAATMEAHLAQLPAELALLFRNLLGPLWKFLTDTIMGAVNDAMAEVLGPVAGALGAAKGAVGQVTGAIEDAKKKAAELQAYAQNVESKAEALMTELSHATWNPFDSNDDNTDEIAAAAQALADAAGADPFSDDSAGGGGNVAAAPTFPANRQRRGKGKKILRSELDQISPNHKWDEAKSAEQADADDAAELAAATSLGDEAGS